MNSYADHRRQQLEIGVYLAPCTKTRAHFVAHTAFNRAQYSAQSKTWLWFVDSNLEWALSLLDTLSLGQVWPDRELFAIQTGNLALSDLAISTLNTNVLHKMFEWVKLVVANSTSRQREYFSHIISFHCVWSMHVDITKRAQDTIIVVWSFTKRLIYQMGFEMVSTVVLGICCLEIQSDLDVSAL